MNCEPVLQSDEIKVAYMTYIQSIRYTSIGYTLTRPLVPSRHHFTSLAVAVYLSVSLRNGLLSKSMGKSFIVTRDTLHPPLQQPG